MSAWAPRSSSCPTVADRSSSTWSTSPPGPLLANFLVVLGHAARRIESAIDVPGLAKIVVNRDCATGQASSLAAGLAACDPSARAALILIADQPELPEEAITRVLDACRRTGGRVVPATCRGTSGHPVLLDRSLSLSGGAADRGAGPAPARRSPLPAAAPRRLAASGPGSRSSPPGAPRDPAEPLHCSGSVAAARPVPAQGRRLPGHDHPTRPAT